MADSDVMVFRYSSSRAWIGAIFIAASMGAGSIGLDWVPDPAPVATAFAIGAAMALFGLWLIAEVAVTKTIVSSTGIKRVSAPFGAVTFQAVWPDIVSYTAHEAAVRGYSSARSYCLCTESDCLWLSGFSSYFPWLHSAVLSHLPPHVQVAIPTSAKGGNEPVQTMSSFRVGSAGVNWGLVVFGCLLGGGVIVASMLELPALFDRTGLPADANRLILASVGGLIIFCSLLLTLKRKDVTIRITPRGVEQWVGSVQATSIAWTEMRSVERLWRSTNDDGTSDPPVSYPAAAIVSSFAIIGPGGRAIAFSSRMREHRALLHALTDHAPRQVALHTGGITRG